MGGCDSLIEAYEEVDGYKLIALRNERFGNVNGYLGVPLHSELYGVHYDDCDLPVHGGWTYSENMHPLQEKPDGYWWFGFDTMHIGDVPDLDWLREEHREEVGKAIFELVTMARTRGETSGVWKPNDVMEELRKAIKSINN